MIKQLAKEITRNYVNLTEEEWFNKYFRPFGKGLAEKEVILLADLLDVFEKFKLGIYTQEQAKSLTEGYCATHT